MPGYLTHLMVLIKAEQWLEELASSLRRKVEAGKAARTCLLPLDSKLLRLANEALQVLRPDPFTPFGLTNALVVGPSQISKFAYAGAIGPDLPAAGHILVMNQRWAFHTLHRGAPRRAWVNASTGVFALKLLDRAGAPGVDRLLREALLGYALGHLAHVAADVILNPAVTHLAWERATGDPTPLQHMRLAVHLDARVAQGFFGREDLHEGDSWTDYFPDFGDFKDVLKPLTKALAEAFVDAYGSDRPQETLCERPAAECVAPRVTAEFLQDGYRNTVNWALDAGYDHGPAFYNVIWGLCIAAAGFLVGYTVISNLADFGVLGSWEAEQVERVRQYNAQAWQQDGFLSERAWYDALSSASGMSGLVFVPFTLLAAGGIGLWLVVIATFPISVPIVLKTGGKPGDGIFGQGSQSMSSKPAWFWIQDLLLTLKPFVYLALERPFPEALNAAAFRWFRLFSDVMLDFYQHFGLRDWSLHGGASAQGFEGNKLAEAFWPLKGGITLFYLASAFLLLAAKAARDDGPAPRYDWADFGISLIFPAVAIGTLVWPNQVVTRHLLSAAAGVEWPTGDTDLVDGYLPTEPATGTTPRRFTDTGAKRLPVRLFAKDDLSKSAEGAAYYPEDGSVKTWDPACEARDEAARRSASRTSTSTYTLNGLVDKAAKFAGLLAMAAVEYDGAHPTIRDKVKKVFKDWNLDYRTEEEWEALMGDEAGVLPTLERILTAPAEDDRLRFEETLGPVDLAGGILADFERTRTSVDADSARCWRLDRPGAILLANLDIDDTITTPLPSPLPDRTPALDAAKDEVINDGNDADELSPLKVRRPPSEAGPDIELSLRVHGADARRIRVFERTGPAASGWPRRLGARTGAAAADAEYALPTAAADPLELRVEALTLPGDPTLPAPSGPTPFAPAPESPGGVVVGAPVFTTRQPGEVWLELLHKQHGAEMPGLRDAALFTIAPFLCLSNIQPTVRVYVNYLKDSAATPRGNHPTVADLADAMIAAVGPARATFNTVPVVGGGVNFVPHTPVPAGHPDAANAFYIIDGSKYFDQWVQDEFEIGYCWAPHAWMAVALHCPRDRALTRFVARELAGTGVPAAGALPRVDVGLFNRLPQPDFDAVDYGGNLEASPPVGTRTPPLPAGSAGPEVPEQPAAPFGKVLLGESRMPALEVGARHAADLDRQVITADLESEFLAEGFVILSGSTVEVTTAGSEWLIAKAPLRYLVKKAGGTLKVSSLRVTRPEYRRFLEAQRVQPILPLDTAWLNVGHVDEFMSIVPATSGKGWRVLMASSQLAVELLDAASDIHGADPVAHPLTDLFRGHIESVDPPISDSRISVADVRTRHKAFNSRLQLVRLTPLEERLKAGLQLDASDIVRLPVLFESIPDPLLPKLGRIIVVGASLAFVRTSAFTPDLVNLLVVDRHVMVPKPFGPRMRTADALDVLSRVGVSGASAAGLAALEGHPHWARRHTPVADLAAEFGVAAAAIEANAKNAGKFAAGAVKNEWDRIWIPEPNVDLFEAYTTTILDRLGLKVHYIDDWDWYHRMEGEVHCGTNALRVPSEAATAGYSGPFWWDTY